MKSALTPLRSLLPVRADFTAMARNPRRDLLAGLTVAIVALPLALGFGVSSGLGAEAGLATAVVAGALALRAVAKQARLAEVGFEADLPGEHGQEERALLAEHIVAYRIDGPLFFAAAHRFLLELAEVADVRVVVLRMSRITTVDATGALVLKDAVEKLNRRGITVIASGIRPGQRRALDSVGALDLLRLHGREFSTTPEAIDGARAHLRGTGVLAGTAARHALTVPPEPIGTDRPTQRREDGPHGNTL